MTCEILVVLHGDCAGGFFMHFVQIAPGKRYSMTFSGSDSRVSDDPWLKIAGEKVVLEIRGLSVGGKTIHPILLTLVPYNPKIAL